MTNILFFGTYKHKVDSKGRVSIPAKWRKTIVNIYQYNNCFFATLIDLLDNYNNIKVCDILPMTTKHNLDKEGRVVFKTEKGKNVVLAGHGNYFSALYTRGNKVKAKKL